MSLNSTMGGLDGLGYGSGTGSDPSLTDCRTGFNPVGVVVADFNGDGKPDIATINGGDSTFSVLLNTTPWPNEKK